MLVIGYRNREFDINKISNVLKKHLEITVVEARSMAQTIKKGQSVKLPNDFVLEDDLKDLGIIIQA